MKNNSEDRFTNELIRITNDNEKIYNHPLYPEKNNEECNYPDSNLDVHKSDETEQPNIFIDSIDSDNKISIDEVEKNDLMTSNRIDLEYPTTSLLNAVNAEDDYLIQLEEADIKTDSVNNLFNVVKKKTKENTIDDNLNRVIKEKGKLNRSKYKEKSKETQLV